MQAVLHTCVPTQTSSCLFSSGTYQFSSLESAPLGTSLGRIQANDPDVGENAETEYSFADSDGSDMFEIITDKDTQEGIITVKKVYFYSSFSGLIIPGFMFFLRLGGEGFMWGSVTKILIY